MGGSCLSYPILYKANETDFTHLGVGVLSESATAFVVEERNGIFEFEMQYPIGGALFSELKNDRLIKVDASPKLKSQRFKIIRITKPANGFVTVYGEHVSYLAQDLALKPEVPFSGTALSALNTWRMNLVDEHPFTVYSDVQTTGSGKWTIYKVENARRALGGVEGSLLDIYGGEYRFDNYHIGLYSQRGDESEALIAYGKNIMDLTQEEEIASTYTSIYPFAILRDGENEELLTLPEYFVDSEHVSKYARRKIQVVDFSQDEIDTVAKLRTRAEGYIKQNSVGVPKVNLKVKFIDLSKTLDYEHLKMVEEINLCDLVTIYFDKLDIKTKAKVIKVTWNVLLDRYEEIEIGEARSSLSNAIVHTLDGKIERVQQRITTVQVAANGKNRIFRGLDQPTTGMSLNDLWYKPVGDGETELYRFDGAYWKLEKVSAGLLGGTLDAENGDVNLINVNVANIVGEISEFIKSYWNNIAGGQITIDGNRFEGSDPDGNRSLINTSGQFRSESGTDGRYGIFDKGRIWFYNEDSSAVLNIGAHPVTGEAGFLKGVLATARAQRLILGRYNDYLTSNINATVNPYISFEYGATVGDEENVYIKNWKDVSMSGKNIDDVQRIEGYELAVRSTQGRLRLGAPQADGTRYNTLEVGAANTISNGSIDMKGYNITNQSDIRLKTNVVDSEVNALREIERMKFIEYDWDFENPANDKKPTGRQFGIVAQYSPFLQTKASGSESYLSVDMSKQVNLNSKAIQELKKENDTLKQELVDLKAVLSEKGLI